MFDPPMALLYVALGWGLLVFNRPWAHFLAARRGLTPARARLLRANVLYNGAATTLLGWLALTGHPLGAWGILATVPVVNLALAPLTASRRH